MSWSPPAWTLVGEAGASQRTPELSSVLQEIVGRPGWASGNALALIITGTGHRTAESFEGKVAAAALLHVEFASGGAQSVHEAAVVAREEPRLDLALHAVSPNPTRGPLRIEFSVAGGEAAMLELLDVAGRRVGEHDVGALGAGRHQVEFRERLPAGIYLVRLTQGTRMRVMKAVVVK